MKIIISYSDYVKKPRNTNFSLEIVPESRGILIEKPVTLEVVLPSVSGDSKIFYPSGKFRRQSIPAVGSPVRQLHSSQSSPILKGSWREKRFSDAVPLLPPAPGKSKVWTEIVQGLTKPQSTSESSQSAAGIRYRKASVPTPSPTTAPERLFAPRAISDEPVTVRQKVSFSIDSAFEVSVKNEVHISD